jgi:hypothetical protein
MQWPRKDVQKAVAKSPPRPPISARRVYSNVTLDGLLPAKASGGVKHAKALNPDLMESPIKMSMKVPAGALLLWLLSVGRRPFVGEGRVSVSPSGLFLRQGPAPDPRDHGHTGQCFRDPRGGGLVRRLPDQDPWPRVVQEVCKLEAREDEGKAKADSWTTAFGRPLGELEAAWRAHLSGK